MTKIFSEKPLTAVFLVALVPRLAAALLLSPPLISDDIEYVAIARSLLAGEGFSIDGAPTAYRPPGYPLLLAGLFALPGGDFGMLRMVQALVDAFSCVLTADIGRRLGGPPAGTTAGVIAALFPLQVLYVPMAMSETAFTFLLLSVYRLYLFAAHDRLAVAAGLLTGVAVLFRPTALVLPLLSVLTPVSEPRPSIHRMRTFGLIVGSMLLAIAPWIVRNHAEFGRVSMTSNAGVNFWMGNHPGASGSYSYPSGNPLETIDGDFARSDAGFRLGLQFWADRPLEAAGLLPKKFAHFFGIDYWVILAHTVQPGWRSSARALDVYRELPAAWMAATHVPLVIIVFGTIAGLAVMTPDERRRWRSVLVIIALWIAVHLVMFGTARYRFPIHPFLIIVTAFAWDRFRTKPVHLPRHRLFLLLVLSGLLVSGWAAELLILTTGSPAPFG